MIVILSTCIKKKELYLELYLDTRVTEDASISVRGAKVHVDNK